MTNIGGIVLCGGKSSRMGQPKAWLPFGDEVLLQRVVRILREVVSPIVVVAAVGQELPDLPPDVLITRDEREALGPVGGLASAFSALRGQVEAAYVSACDVPLLKSEVVRRICDQLGDADIAITVDGQFPHPLAAVYRLTLEDRARQLLEAGRLRPVFLWEGAKVNQVPIESLRDIDPELDSFRNANTPEEYQAVLTRWSESQ
jgi:molybdopterin-guanine dinucleotide biosynthesis protein A